MSVRLKIALTVVLTGLIATLGVIVTVALAFQRFEHETTYDRADAFLGRVIEMYDDVLDMHHRDPQAFGAWMRNLLLFEPNSQLYLLAADGTVLASTGQARLPPGFKVAMAPVREAVDAAMGMRRAPYIMGDDPEHMSDDAVIAARALKRAVIHPSEPVAGYLYMVCQKRLLPPGRLEVFRSSLAGPALAGVGGVIVFTTLMAVWIIGAVTRPLRVLSNDVAQASREGFRVHADPARETALPESLALTTAAAGIRPGDEFGQLREGFRALLKTLRMQWDALRRLDHLRREGVSNLSHDLRSPLTATVACLETLEQRWSGDNARQDDTRLVEIALRNTRNAAQLVRSLGDLAQLDEPAFALHAEVFNLAEVLDDVAVRFADRAARQGVALAFVGGEGPEPYARVDIELFERALANLLDNALKFTPEGGRIELHADVAGDGRSVQVQVRDTGPGIAAADLPHLFDRLYQARTSVAPAGSEGGKGLGLAIVKRIAELHEGQVTVDSVPGQGTTVTLRLPRQLG